MSAADYTGASDGNLDAYLGADLLSCDLLEIYRRISEVAKRLATLTLLDLERKRNDENRRPVKEDCLALLDEVNCGADFSSPLSRDFDSTMKALRVLFFGSAVTEHVIATYDPALTRMWKSKDIDLYLSGLPYDRQPAVVRLLARALPELGRDSGRSIDEIWLTARLSGPICGDELDELEAQGGEMRDEPELAYFFQAEVGSANHVLSCRIGTKKFDICAGQALRPAYDFGLWSPLITEHGLVLPSAFLEDLDRIKRGMPISLRRTRAPAVRDRASDYSDEASEVVPRSCETPEALQRCFERIRKTADAGFSVLPTVGRLECRDCESLQSWEVYSENRPGLFLCFDCVSLTCEDCRGVFDALFGGDPPPGLVSTGRDESVAR